MSLIRRHLMKSICSVTYDLNGLAPTGEKYALLGNTYCTSFTVLDDKQFIPSSVRVYMNGLEITDNVFNIETNEINIPSVSGDIYIEGEALTVSSEMLQNYNIIPYISCISATSSPGIRLGIIPTEKTRFCMSYKYAGGTLNFLIMPQRKSADDYNSIYFAAATKSGVDAFYAVWNCRRGVLGKKSILEYYNRRVDIDINKGFFKLECKSIGQINTVNMYNESDSFNGNTFGIFGNTSSVASGATLGNVYGAKHYENDVLISNFIPVLRKTDNKVGLLDINNNQFKFKDSQSWTPPYIYITNSYTNCTSTVLSANNGDSKHTVIGKTWSCKFTPSTAYTFNSPNSTFSVIVNDENVTNNKATYDNTTDIWTVTLIAHWKDKISITANAISSE